MRLLRFLALIVCPWLLPAQVGPGRFPPDSLVNVQILPRSMPVIEVIGLMRNFSADLGVRCQFCHVGEDGLTLAQFDFSDDAKRTKLVARQMMRMVEEINRRVDTLPGRGTSGVRVTCRTCHHGISRPVPLSALMVELTQSDGVDSALRAYSGLLQRFFGSDAYDFGESSLNVAAFRLGRVGRFEQAFALLRANEERFPSSSGMAVFRGNIELMRSDTVAAVAAFREAVRRDSTNTEALGRLRAVGAVP